MTIPWSKRKISASPDWGPHGQVVNAEGLTLIECLVAIVMVALVGAIIAPAMVLSVATRVQSQKAEQALELAQSEIDKIRVLIEQGGYEVADLPPSTTITGGDEKKLATVSGPSYSTTFPSTPTAADASRLDIDGDGTFDFAIQTFRTPGKVVGSTPVNFGMGVRVYDYRAFTSGGTGNLPADEQASLAMTSGEGERISKPLAVLYTNIAASEQSSSFCNFIDYLEAGASTPQGCD